MNYTVSGGCGIRARKTKQNKKKSQKQRAGADAIWVPQSPPPQ